MIGSKPCRWQWISYVRRTWSVIVSRYCDSRWKFWRFPRPICFWVIGSKPCCWQWISHVWRTGSVIVSRSCDSRWKFRRFPRPICFAASAFVEKSLDRSHRDRRRLILFCSCLSRLCPNLIPSESAKNSKVWFFCGLFLQLLYCSTFFSLLFDRQSMVAGVIFHRLHLFIRS